MRLDPSIRPKVQALKVVPVLSHIWMAFLISSPILANLSILTWPVLSFWPLHVVCSLRCFLFFKKVDTIRAGFICCRNLLKWAEKSVATCHETINVYREISWIYKLILQLGARLGMQNGCSPRFGDGMRSFSLAEWDSGPWNHSWGI